MACAKRTKWVVGVKSMISCTGSGMLSRGVMPPESVSRGGPLSRISGRHMKIPIEVSPVGFRFCRHRVTLPNSHTLVQGTDILGCVQSALEIGRFARVAQ